MKLYSADGSELMTINGLARDGNTLLIKGKVLGTLPMTARLNASAVRAGLKLLTPRLLFFVLTLPFRRGSAR